MTGISRDTERGLVEEHRQNQSLDISAREDGDVELVLISVMGWWKYRKYTGGFAGRGGKIEGFGKVHHCMCVLETALILQVALFFNNADKSKFVILL